MTIWCIDIACLIPKATNRHSQYAVLTAFPLQKRLYHGTSVDSWPLKMGPIGCPETSVRKYHHTLRQGPEERSFHVVRGGNLKSRIACLVLNETQYVYCAVRNEFLNIIQILSGSIALHSHPLIVCFCVLVQLT